MKKQSNEENSQQNSGWVTKGSKGNPDSTPSTTVLSHPSDSSALFYDNNTKCLGMASLCLLAEP